MVCDVCAKISIRAFFKGKFGYNIAFVGCSDERCLNGRYVCIIVLRVKLYGERKYNRQG